MGTLAARQPRGLTSNRHAGRPDRTSIRAFAFVLLQSFLGTAVPAMCCEGALAAHEGGKAMPKRMMLALFLATLAIGPATAQQAERGGVRTETMSRLAGENSGNDVLWNLIGLLGLLGLIGLLPKHEEDSYHPASLE
jgi:hypothetical protein